jgi:hypothetical protein
LSELPPTALFLVPAEQSDDDLRIKAGWIGELMQVGHCPVWL